MSACRPAVLYAAVLLAASSLAGIASAQPAHDEPGTVVYKGAFEGGNGELRISPAHGGMSHVSVGGGGNGCGMDVSGQAAVHGATLVMTKATDGSECHLTIRRSAAGATVQENSCMMWHGAACSFNSSGTLHPVR